MAVHIGEIITSVELDPGSDRATVPNSSDRAQIERLLRDLEDDLIDRTAERVIELLREQNER